MTNGTYSCPVCGWNEPHYEHAGELYARIRAMSLAGNDLVRRLVTLKGQHGGTRAVDDEIDNAVRRWSEAQTPQPAAALSPSEGPGGQTISRASERSDAGERQDLRENPDTKGSER